MTAAAANPANIIIEGEFRVVAERVLTTRNSPNTRRTVARILCWNAIFVGAVIVLPHLFS